MNNAILPIGAVSLPPQRSGPGTSRRLPRRPILQIAIGVAALAYMVSFLVDTVAAIHDGAALSAAPACAADTAGPGCRGTVSVVVTSGCRDPARRRQFDLVVTIVAMAGTVLVFRGHESGIAMIAVAFVAIAYACFVPVLSRGALLRFARAGAIPLR